MLQVETFVFNPIQVNTYVLYDETNECAIVDCACHSQNEEQQLVEFVKSKGLRPIRLLNTHLHFDHAWGNAFAKQYFGLQIEADASDAFFIQSAVDHAQAFGFSIAQPPQIDHNIADMTGIAFGNSELQILHTPGHSPGGLCFYSKQAGFVVSGDVLFQAGIGRTDLPKGDYDTLIQSIKTKLFQLPDETVVYPGHGPKTSIGVEKQTNPFCKIS